MPFYCECGRELDDMWEGGDGSLMVDCEECGVHEWSEGPGTVVLVDDEEEVATKVMYCSECHRRFVASEEVYLEYGGMFVCEDHPDPVEVMEES